MDSTQANINRFNPTNYICFVYGFANIYMLILCPISHVIFQALHENLIQIKLT